MAWMCCTFSDINCRFISAAESPTLCSDGFGRSQQIPEGVQGAEPCAFILGTAIKGSKATLTSFSDASINISACQLAFGTCIRPRFARKGYRSLGQISFGMSVTTITCPKQCHFEFMEEVALLFDSFQKRFFCLNFCNTLFHFLLFPVIFYASQHASGGEVGIAFKATFASLCKRRLCLLACTVYYQ